jgi:putative transposase
VPRPARLTVAGILWHIIQRGNSRATCFYCADDYLRYLKDLAEQAMKYGCHIHAYCLMTNHVQGIR